MVVLSGKGSSQVSAQPGIRLLTLVQQRLTCLPPPGLIS
jgi:hypothetical protein